MTDRSGPPRWHRAEISAALKKRGTNLRKLGLENGFALNTLSASLYKRHPRAHALIAEVIGVSPAEIWPEWYGSSAPSSGRERARSGRPESSLKRAEART